MQGAGRRAHSFLALTPPPCSVSPMTEDTTPTTTTVTWKPAGPYVIEGPIVVRDNEGTVLEPPATKVPGQVKLCGCGHSLNKPFCDGSHKR